MKPCLRSLPSRSEEMAKYAAILLAFFAFCGISFALAVGPRIYEQKDLGNTDLKEFTYSLSAECNESTISAYVMNESNKPVQEANVYLKYVDFSTPLMSSSKTDKDGFTLIRLPGNIKLMRGLFIMVIEKTGYRNKEIHFDLSPCFGGSTLPPPPANHSNQTTNATNQTGPPKPPANNSTTNPPPGNGTTSGNATNQTNQSGAGDGNDVPGPAPLCPAAAGLLLIVLALCPVVR